MNPARAFTPLSSVFLIWSVMAVTASATPPLGTPVTVIHNGATTGDALLTPNYIWSSMSTTGAPSGRSDAENQCVWTGATGNPATANRFIVWGGDDSVHTLTSGGIYNPATDTWSAMSTTSAPVGTADAVAVWTGNTGNSATSYKMIVVGGDTYPTYATVGTGGIYDPATDSWTATSTVGAPALEDCSAVWTGNTGNPATSYKMIVFGGTDDVQFTSNAIYIYDPAANTWTNPNPANPPTGRYLVTCVWSGNTGNASTSNKMIMYGGEDYSTSAVRNDGAMYDPAANTWTALPANATMGTRENVTPVWTGSAMVSWGGDTDSNTPSYPTGGASYNPGTNAWTNISTTSVPSGRQNPAFCWTGDSMIVYGGATYSGGNWTLKNDGGMYFPATNTWGPLPTSGIPTTRWLPATVWTGSQFIVFGGYTNSALTTVTNTGGVLTNLPSVPLGSGLTGTPIAQSFNIDNSAGTGPLTGATVTFTGTNASDFSVATAPSASIATGGNSAFTINFTPGGAGARSATMVITSNDPNRSPYLVALSGTGIAPLAATQAIASEILTEGQTSANFTPVTASGGAGGYSYGISPALGNNLSFNTSTGAITGVPSGTLTANTYTVTVTDSTNATASNTFSLTINPPAPIAVADGPSNYATSVNRAFGHNAPGVLNNDTLNGGSISSYGATTGLEQTSIGTATPTAQGGSIVLRADGSFTYTPASNYTGNDTFKYVLTNAGGHSTATVSLYVDTLPTVTSTTPVNNATSVNVNTAITINFSEQIDTTTAFQISPPVAFNQTPADGNASNVFTLTPTASLAPGQQYTVTVLANQTADLDGGLSMASNYSFSFTTLPLPVPVNDPPGGGTYQVTANVKLDSALLTPSSSVFDNDVLNGATVTYGPSGPTASTPVDGTTTVLSFMGGTVLMRTNGTFTYTPAPGFTGTDRFFYKLTNASVTLANPPIGTPQAQAIFTVNANQAPTLNAISNPAAIPVNSPQQSVSLSGITDGIGDTGQTLTVSATSNNQTLIPNANISKTYTSPNTTGTVSYTPAANQFGTAVITVTVQDNGGTASGGVDTVTQTFTVTVNPPAPTISSISPTAGPTAGGTVVILTGTNFTGATAVKFGGTNAASFTVNSATSITATSPAGSAGTVDVTVTTPNGTSSTGPADQFTYVAAPVVSSIAPTAGPTAGGTSVVITGNNFSGATAVMFGANSATSFTVNSSSQITATSPSGSGTVDVTVTTVGGTSATSPADQFTYDPLPTAGSLTPIAGPTAGNTSVTITGGNFITGQTSVTIGGTVIPAGSVTVSSPTSLSFSTPAHAAGNVAISVTTPGGTSSAVPSGFTYDAAPTATGILNDYGPTAGLFIDTITGSNFVTGQTSVTVDTTVIPAGSVTVVNPGQLQFTWPAHAAGNVSVTVTTPGGTSSSLPSGFNYVAPPTATGLSPNAGPTTGNTSVTITGTNFVAGQTSVTLDINTIPAMAVTVNSPTSLTFSTFAHAAGSVPLSVTTPGGNVPVNGNFTFDAAPTAGGLTPIAGPTAGGTSVTITGTNFVTGNTSVTIGGTVVPAGSVTVSSATSLSFSTPANAAGNVAVTVTTPGGTSSNVPGGFTYDAVPTATVISSPQGPASGGTVETLTGTNFVAGNTSVTVGLIPATSVTVTSPTSLTFVTPSGPGTTSADVEVTTPGGTSTGGPEFTWVPLPAVTGISPAAGPATGGTGVTISGSGLQYVTSVQFGSVNASFTGGKAGLVATAPAGTGVVDVTVTSAGGTSATAPADQYTYVPAPVVTGLSPASGPTTGGTSVTISGTNFTGATAVTFGGANATSFSVTGATSISATAPAGAGTVDVIVTTTGGASATAPADQFIYDSVSITSTNTSTGGTFTFSRAAAIAGAITVNFTLDGASNADTSSYTLTGTGVAYSGGTGTVVIPDGVNFAQVTLTASNSTGTAQPTQTVVLDVASGAGYNIGPSSSATVTIAQNGFVVTNTNDSGEGSLRQAILNANALGGNPAITFDPTVFASGVTVTVTGELPIMTAGMSITAPTAGVKVVSTTDAGPNGLFTSQANGAITLTGLDIESNFVGVDSDGGIVNLSGCFIRAANEGITAQAGTTTVVNCTMTGSGNGFGFATGGAPATLINCTISGNGAGIFSTSSQLLLENCLVASNGALDVEGTVLSTSSYNLIGVDTQMTGITNGANGNQIGTSGSPINAKLGTLGNYGGPTQTYALLDGSPAINAGSNANLPTNPVVQTVNVSGSSSGFFSLTYGAATTNALPASSTASFVQFALNNLPSIGGIGGSVSVYQMGTDYVVTFGGTLSNNSTLLTSTASGGTTVSIVDTIPYDQRGPGFPRVRGPAVDIGAVEALLYTPTVTQNASTPEDTLSGSLVITPNSADGGLTVGYQITGITNGQLYQNDGVTLVANGSFVTVAQGSAGLKFLPSTNLNSYASTFGFSVQASTTGDATGLAGSVVSAGITVNPVADTPSVTNASTTENTQTTSGLVVSRSAVDGPETGYFEITNIQHGTVYLNDGVTPIAAGGFITVAQGNAGLKFTPSTGFLGVASFLVQASNDGIGTGSSPTVTASINVGTVNPTPLALSTSTTLNRQSGLSQLTVNVTNTTAFPINGFRLLVNYSSYLSAYPTLRLYNATSGPGDTPVYVDYPYPVAVGATIAVNLEFYTSNRVMPNPFAPVLTVQALTTSETPITNETGTPVSNITKLADKTVLLEWASVAGSWYRVSYSSDLVNWYDSPTPIQASSNQMQWIDSGPPFTSISPADPSVTSRFYIVNQIPTP